MSTSEFLPSIWRLGRDRNTKFGTNVANKMLLNAANCTGYSLYRFWVIKGKPTGGVKLHSLEHYLQSASVSLAVVQRRQAGKQGRDRYLCNKKSLLVKQKAFFVIFQVFSFAFGTTFQSKGLNKHLIIGLKRTGLSSWERGKMYLIFPTWKRNIYGREAFQRGKHLFLLIRLIGDVVIKNVECVY